MGTYPVKMQEFNPEFDSFFLKKMAIPYFSEVFYGLISRGTKDYLSLSRTKQYLSIPEPICDRICCQINANGDERIDHDEFIEFLVTALMGNVQQKMWIAFKCFDLEDNDYITNEEVKYILKHVPINIEKRYGISFGFYDQEAQMTKDQVQKIKMVDDDQINSMVDTIFSEYPDGMYFNEFEEFSREISSELVVAVFDCLY